MYPEMCDGVLPEPVKKADDDIVGEAGQAVRSGPRTTSEQIAEWGGFVKGEIITDQTGEKAVDWKGD